MRRPFGIISPTGSFEIENKCKLTYWVGLVQMQEQRSSSSGSTSSNQSRAFYYNVNHWGTCAGELLDSFCSVVVVVFKEEEKKKH